MANEPERDWAQKEGDRIAESAYKYVHHCQHHEAIEAISFAVAAALREAQGQPALDVEKAAKEIANSLFGGNPQSRVRETRTLPTIRNILARHFRTDESPSVDCCYQCGGTGCSACEETGRVMLLPVPPVEGEDNV